MLFKAPAMDLMRILPQSVTASTFLPTAVTSVLVHLL